MLAQQGLSKALCDLKLEKMEVLDWEGLQERVATTIHLCWVDEVLYHVMELTSLGEVWKKLESQYMLKSLMNKPCLKQELYGLKM